MTTVLVTHNPSALANYYGPRALAALRAVADVRLNPSEADWTSDRLARAAQGCDIVVSYRITGADAALFDRLPDLLAWCRCAVDIRNIDVAAASARGILVTRATPGFVASVAEWIVGAMIDLSRHISAAVIDYRAGIVPAARMGRELRGATLGIVGYGQIGRRLADLGLALGMRVLVNDPHVRIDDPAMQQVDFVTLLAQADPVVCLAVANPATENLFDAAAFAAMRPGAMFVNASRGNLVDEAALLAALDRGQLSGCALDVGREPDQMPSLALARHPRVIATPHVGGLTPQAIEHQAMDTVAQVAELVRGRMPAGAVNAGQATRLQARWGGPVAAAEAHE
ncbi:MAG: NAD(P)-dependent oxidoreductase [Burkholderiaceae bacterium]